MCYLHAGPKDSFLHIIFSSTYVAKESDRDLLPSATKFNWSLLQGIEENSWFQTVRSAAVQFPTSTACSCKIKNVYFIFLSTKCSQHLRGREELIRRFWTNTGAAREAHVARSKPCLWSCSLLLQVEEFRLIFPLHKCSPWLLGYMFSLLLNKIRSHIVTV